MKAKFGREIGLMLLPVLIIGGVALWKTNFGGYSGWGVPLGLLEGAPRLEVRGWKRVEPTALDFGRGISSRWTVTAWNGGTCPTGRKQPYNQGVGYPHNLVFTWKRGGRWHKTPIKFPQSELDVVNLGQQQKPAQHEVRLGLPLDIVPHDAEEVRLQGRLDGWMNCMSGSVNAPSPPLDVLLKGPQEAWPRYAGSRVPVLKLHSVRQNWLRPNLAKDRYAADLEIEGVFIYSGPPNSGYAQKARSWITDAKGQQVWEILSADGYSVQKGMTRAGWLLSTRRMASHKGPFMLKSWVYVDIDEWPLLVSIPINLVKPTNPVR